MCVRSTRNSQYYEKVSDPLDLSTIEKQILTGHYKTVEAFDTDMLKVFRNAEVSVCASRKRKEPRRGCSRGVKLWPVGLTWPTVALGCAGKAMQEHYWGWSAPLIQHKYH